MRGDKLCQCKEKRGGEQKRKLVIVQRLRRKTKHCHCEYRVNRERLDVCVDYHSKMGSVSVGYWPNPMFKTLMAVDPNLL